MTSPWSLGCQDHSVCGRTGSSDRRGDLSTVAKRFVDVTVGTALAVAVTPLVLSLALLLTVQFRASPFFTQERVGHTGQRFRVVKLRTLPPDAPRYADKYAISGVCIPPLPALLRRLHVDELPQLWLVPLGRMSLVGPRPEMAFLQERMDDAQRRARLALRPGCTGLWQVSAHSAALIHEHPEYDLAYHASPTLRMDAWIMWQTLRMLVGRPGRVTLSDVPGWVVRQHAESVVVGSLPTR